MTPMQRVPLVRATIGDVNSLVDTMVADLVPGGGFSWWSGYALAAEPAKSLEARQDLSDYLIEVSSAVASNLEAAEFFADQHKRGKHRLDEQWRARLHAGHDFYSRTDESAIKQLKAYAQAFVGSISATLDTLAGTIVGVGGLRTPLVKADISVFRPFSGAEDYIQALERKRRRKSIFLDASSGRDEQMKLVLSLRASVLAAGPAGWDLWTDQVRNAAFHRGRHLEMMIATADSQGRAIFPAVLPAEPSMTTLQILRMPGRGDIDLFIPEDLDQIISGVLGAVATTVCGTLPQLRRLWDLRRYDPRLIPQPPEQIHTPTEVGFKGFAPDPSLANGTTKLVADPQTVRRMASGGVIRQGRGVE